MSLRMFSLRFPSIRCLGYLLVAAAKNRGQICKLGDARDAKKDVVDSGEPVGFAEIVAGDLCHQVELESTYQLLDECTNDDEN